MNRKASTSTPNLNKNLKCATFEHLFTYCVSTVCRALWKIYTKPFNLAIFCCSFWLQLMPEQGQSWYSLILLALSVYGFICPLLRPPLSFCWIILGVEGQENHRCYKGHQRNPPCFPDALVARTDLDITENGRRKMQIPPPL